MSDIMNFWAGLAAGYACADLAFVSGFDRVSWKIALPLSAVLLVIAVFFEVKRDMKNAEQTKKG